MLRVNSIAGDLVYPIPGGPDLKQVIVENFMELGGRIAQNYNLIFSEND